ncbi:phosphatidylinositol 3,4,5-trisphosphate 3-phosphatase and dual-specificity protein phosphatase PTEN isoform X3 [Hermetia illucens]|uniref:phosphatidylinositol 3,4,5-trisphosphate 3-phosphatase and dual-specificity protein phosphatase PTEN isoform X3 n=1 Tax=Hermetia illucens TaxID=343691 RepID=UPI0018CC0B8E|nr:phosphatidylinositol 3,4,5-trisphosphate 3-phosphatase and dual-specificity protein phosphatase PTEN isoform X3 [Hermetia illucens]
MANTISVMTNAVRGVVSKKRIRYQENGYDLDLAYVSDRLIAMGYPAENIESIFRNKIEHVYHFLEEKHKDHYKIYNLCSERHYDGNRFHGRVALYPFDDHNPPPVTLIKEFCDDVDAWLKADKDNVAAVHCKAGKGRTGTMICCYLLHCHMKTTAESALTYYDEKRTKNKKGVTIPSQRRYVEYYAKLVNSGQPYEERTLQICEIRFFPQLSNQDNIHCSIYPHPRSDDAESTNITLNFRKTQIIEINDRCIPLTGDVKIEVYRKVMKRKERYFHFWFNTFFIGDKAAAYEDDGSEKKFVYELSKHELDDAHKDTEHKTVPQDFKVQLLFKTVQKDHHTTMPSITPAIASVRNDANSHVRSHYKVPFSQQNHHPHYNQTQLSNNIGMNHTNSNLVICKSALSPVNNINATTTTANKLTSNSTRLSSMGSSSSGSSIGDQQQSTGTFSMRNSSVNPLKKDLKLQNHTKDCNDVMELQPSYPDHGIELGVNEQPMLDLFMNGSGRDTSSAIAAGETHTPSVRFEVSRTNSSSRSSSINSSEVSPQSEVGGDEDEGWDSEFCRVDSSKGESTYL